MFSRISRFFAPRKPAAPLPQFGHPIGQPIVSQTKVTFLGRPPSWQALHDHLLNSNADHAYAALDAFSRGQRVLAKHPELAPAGARNVHLVHVRFSPWTSLAVGQGRLPLGAGNQLGAAICLRGREGHLHAYAMVAFDGGAK